MAQAFVGTQQVGFGQFSSRLHRVWASHRCKSLPPDPLAAQNVVTARSAPASNRRQI
jgi:hypothetical protein